MESRCSECDRLQREYTEANKIFLAIAGEKAHVLVQQDPAELSRVEARYQAAGERRKAARNALNAHKEAHGSWRPDVENNLP